MSMDRARECFFEEDFRGLADVYMSCRDKLVREYIQKCFRDHFSLSFESNPFFEYMKMIREIMDASNQPNAITNMMKDCSCIKVVSNELWLNFKDSFRKKCVLLVNHGTEDLLAQFYNHKNHYGHKWIFQTDGCRSFGYIHQIYQHITNDITGDNIDIVTVCMLDVSNGMGDHAYLHSLGVKWASE